MPAYARLGEAPAIALWRAKDLPSGWRPADCIAWAAAPLTLLVAVAGEFQAPGDADALLSRIGAVSRMKAIRYWSVNRGEWETLFAAMVALADPDPRQKRADFTPLELRGGRDHFFLQQDNRSGEAVVNRLTVRRADADRIVFETVNVNPITRLFVTLYAPGALHSIYFLTRQGGAVWAYYSLSWIGPGQPLLSSFVRPESYINRADALFRYLAGIQTDRMPPAAP